MIERDGFHAVPFIVLGGNDSSAPGNGSIFVVIDAERARNGEHGHALHPNSPSCIPPQVRRPPAAAIPVTPSHDDTRTASHSAAA